MAKQLNTLIAPDTFIITRDKVLPVSNIDLGTEILTHKGLYQPVTKVNRRDYTGFVTTLIRARSNIKLELTSDSYIMGVQAEPCPFDKRRCLPRLCHYHKQKRHLGCPNFAQHYELKWIQVKELKSGDFIFYPNVVPVPVPNQLIIPQSSHFNSKPIPCELKISSELMEWFGYFAAEGFVDTNSVHFANYEDAERIAQLGENLFGLEGTIKELPYKTKRIRFNSRNLSKWMEEQIGRGAANKHLPDWVMSIDSEKRRALLKALMRSDGSFRKDKENDKSHSYRYGSASPTLAHQISRLLQLEGISCTFEISYPKQEGRNINGKAIKVNHPSYRICVYDVASVNHLLSATQEAPAYEEHIVRQPYDNYPFQQGWLYSLKKVSHREATFVGYHIETEGLSCLSINFTIGVI